MSNPLFGTIPLPKLKRNSFNLSHEVKLTMQMGKLVPIICQPCIPGDTWRVSSEVMVRVAPMLAPIMHRVNVYVHYFFVPNRLLWDNWKDFITGGKDGKAAPAMPVMNVSYFPIHPAWKYLVSDSSLWDYLGLPSVDDIGTDGKSQTLVQVLPFRAYQLIYNEYYRDENLDPEVPIHTEVDGNLWNTLVSEELRQLFTLRNRAWEKDYFSGALPWPQRGADVELPLAGGDAPVYMDSAAGVGNLNLDFRTDGGAYTAGDVQINTGTLGVITGGPDGDARGHSVTTPNRAPVSFHGELAVPIRNAVENMNLTADMSQVTMATINELRRAFALQRWYETNARGGSRYIEQIEAHFGVRSSDARLQRPQYIGGGKTTLVVSEVIQTSDSSSADSSPLGDMAGHGISVGKTMNCKCFCEEHGYIMGILSIIPKPTYQQGIPRDFLKTDRYDFYFPAFANLGEQEVWNEELYVRTDNPRGTFGYVPRYAEYKYIPSTVHGDFRHSMNFWHLGRIFANEPTLSSEFVHVDEKRDDLSRVFAAMYDPETGEENGNPTNASGVYDHFWVYIYNKVYAKREMPRYGIPKL